MARFKTGIVTLSASAQQIHPQDSNEFSQYKLKALSANAGNVYIGDSGVTTANGYVLEPGDEMLYDYDIGAAPLADVVLDQWWVVGTAGDKLAWLAFLQ